MNAEPELTTAPRPGYAESEAFPEMVSSARQMLERGDALEAWRAFADGALAAVPHAFEAYIAHHRFDLI